MTAPIFHGTREQWAEAVINHLQAPLAALGIEPVREDFRFRVALAPLSSKVLGLAYRTSLSSDSVTSLVSINTMQADPIEMVHTLLHETLHAYDDCASGHKGRWRRWADLIGIQAKGHERGLIAEQLVQEALATVGIPVAHVPTVPIKPKPPSQIKLRCTSCALSVWMARAAAQEGRKVICNACGVELKP